jgi:hypothetical protein
MMENLNKDQLLLLLMSEIIDDTINEMTSEMISEMTSEMTSEKINEKTTPQRMINLQKNDLNP